MDRDPRDERPPRSPRSRYDDDRTRYDDARAFSRRDDRRGHSPRVRDDRGREYSGERDRGHSRERDRHDDRSSDYSQGYGRREDRHAMRERRDSPAGDRHQDPYRNRDNRDRSEPSRHRDRERVTYDDYDGGRGRGREYDRPEPSATVVIKGVPPHADRAMVWESFSRLGALLRDVRIAKDKFSALSVTGMSGSTHENTVAEAFSALGNLQSVRSTPRGEPYAITLTFDSVATATQVLTSARAANDGRGMVVDGRELSVDFARVTGSSQLAGPATGAAAAAIQAAMAMSAAAKMQGGAYGASAPVAAGAAAAPVAQVVPAAGMLAGVPEGLVYDATSGYYYDKTTGYYYDSSTGYYYDGKTGAYFWWDPTNKAYMPISGPTAATAEATATETPPESSQSQEKDAKKVAADMERWAKKRKREEEKAKKIKLSLKRPAEQLTNPDASAPAPEETTPSTGGWVFEPESASDATAQHLEAQSASDADTDEVQLPEDAILLARYSKVGTDPWELAQGRGHIDISQGTCLLCQRGLGSEEKLEKHVRGSKLHATNLTEARDSIIAALSAAQKDAFERAVREASYRDRAAERRTTFGQSKKAPKRRAIAAASRADEAAKPIVQPNRKGIADNNLGSKMLRQMGWTKGQGLGKAGQGITAPIVAQKHVSGAGIGAAPVIGADEVVADTYKGQAALIARARYNQQ